MDAARRPYDVLVLEYVAHRIWAGSLWYGGAAEAREAERSERGARVHVLTCGARIAAGLRSTIVRVQPCTAVRDHRAILVDLRLGTAAFPSQGRPRADRPEDLKIDRQQTPESGFSSRHWENTEGRCGLPACAARHASVEALSAAVGQECSTTLG
jgi:hypothetical protein